jgi:NADPH-dependent curcumin reductase CurA
VSAASGAVGSVAGQIARLRGCRVVGIAGGAVKCRHVMEELGFDACPRRIDVDFQNVGGVVRDTVWEHLNDFARVVLCGLVSEYNRSAPTPGPDWSGILFRRISLRGFLLRDHQERRQAFLDDMLRWLKAGQIVHREDVSHGIESAPAAFCDMLAGRKIGKTIVAVA